MIELSVLHLKFTGWDFIEKVYISIFYAFQRFPIQLTIIGVSQPIKRMVLLILNFFSRSQIIRWHHITMLFLHSTKLTNFILCSILSVRPHIDHHDFTPIENVLFRIEFLLATVSRFVIIGNNVWSVLWEFRFLLWIGRSLSFLIFPVVIYLKVIGWFGLVFLLIFCGLLVCCNWFLLDGFLLWSLLFLDRLWKRITLSGFRSLKLTFPFWRSCLFFFFLAFTLEHTRLGLKDFSFRGKINDLLKLLVVFEDSFDDGICFLVDFRNLFFWVVIILPRLLFDDLRIQEILFDFDLFSFEQVNGLLYFFDFGSLIGSQFLFFGILEF